MNPAWLGRYTDNGDTWEGGRRTIRFSPTPEGPVRFDYTCRHESNHGYDQSSALGRVLAVDAAAITIELALQESSSWEDMFKEHLTHEDASPRQVIVEIARIADGKPVLRYNDAWFVFERS